MGESVTHTHLVFVPFPCTELLKNPWDFLSGRGDGSISGY